MISPTKSEHPGGRKIPQPSPYAQGAAKIMGFRGAASVEIYGFCPHFGDPLHPGSSSIHPGALLEHSALVGATGSAQEAILRPKTGQNEKRTKCLPITRYSEISYGFWVHSHGMWEESYGGS